jgi:rhamnose utilization protein RhaD (predicted bifunctional aldolase and dehydrogenase)/NAD(P)-dependent dehydrogenase (short-subunit alcohol dehydrogenase family)
MNPAGREVRSLWDDREASEYRGDLAQRVYSSRLLGRDPTLVIHGGGNTSVKIRERNLFGEEEDVLYVKGSGWDLATIEPAGFSPVRLSRVLALSRLASLTDVEMAEELRTSMTRASAPAPSVEAILHALLPDRYVDHTHADAFIAVSNTSGGEERLREVYGEDVLVLPYVMPGFALARCAANLLAQRTTRGLIGVALANHGLFSFGASAGESYERMIGLVDRAERYLANHNAWFITAASAAAPLRPSRLCLATLRSNISDAARAPMIASTHSDDQARSFVQRDDVCRVSQQGPATPDHVIRTKRLPMLGRDVEGYSAEYRRYVAENAERAGREVTPLDPAPRVVLDPALGMITVGRTAAEAAVAEDIYRHTIEIIERAERLDAYQALPASDIFDVEYWSLEQAKIRGVPAGRPLAGEVALVTGAASGIGKACARALRESGAAVVGLDLNPDIASAFDGPDALGLRCDVTDSSAIEDALDTTIRRFGGLDILILNAGVFPGGSPIADLADDEWTRVFDVNLDANLSLLRASHPLLRLAPRGGRVVVIGSKNVPAPGPEAAAYSSSKAALTQLARVAALEWGRDGIRVNTLHPNAVFDTGLWTEDVLEARARSYGLSVDEYRRNNVLGVEVTSRDVADLAVALCTPLFSKTTGAQIPVDGGNERVI